MGFLDKIFRRKKADSQTPAERVAAIESPTSNNATANTSVVQCDKCKRTFRASELKTLGRFKVCASCDRDLDKDVDDAFGGRVIRF